MFVFFIIETFFRLFLGEVSFHIFCWAYCEALSVCISGFEMFFQLWLSLIIFVSIILISLEASMILRLFPSLSHYQSCSFSSFFMLCLSSALWRELLEFIFIITSSIDFNLTISLLFSLFSYHWFIWFLNPNAYSFFIAFCFYLIKTEFSFIYWSCNIAFKSLFLGLVIYSVQKSAFSLNL